MAIKQDRPSDDFQCNHKFPDLVNDAGDSRVGIMQARHVCLVCNCCNSLQLRGLKRAKLHCKCLQHPFSISVPPSPLPNTGSSASARNLEMERLLSFPGSPKIALKDAGLARNAAEELYLLQTVSMVSTGSRKDSRQSFAGRSGCSPQPGPNNLTICNGDLRYIR